MTSNPHKDEYFEVFGEEFPIANYPCMYKMFVCNKTNLEETLKSIATAWHEGSIVSAAQAFESDMHHDFGVNPDDNQVEKEKEKVLEVIEKSKENRKWDDFSFTLPPAIRGRFGDTVIIGRGSNNTLCLYTPAELNESLDDLERRVKWEFLDYKQLRSSILSGMFATKCKVREDGRITIPGLLHCHLDSQGELIFETRRTWLQMRRKHGNWCLCDNPKCAKCLGVNCRNPECSTHSKEDKARWRSRVKNQEKTAAQNNRCN